MSKYTGFILGVLFISLAAAKPWGSINKALGITHPTAKTATVLTQPDSLFVDQSAAVILAPSVADTMATAISEVRHETQQQQKQLDYLKEQKELLTGDVERMKGEVKKLQARRVKESQSLLHEQELERMLSQQNTHTEGTSAKAKTQRMNPTTVLLDDENDRKHPN